MEAMLIEGLDRALEELGADTAAVLLVDPAGKELIATAARGIEEEVRQGVRVPLGRGFAGRVAAERRPVVLDEVGPHTVSNPILWQKGIRAILGVPLLVNDELVGVMHVGTLKRRVFRPDDVGLLEEVADRVAHTVRVALLEAENAGAVALQRSLLPSIPDRIGDLELAARYVPSGIGGVGGDWYDVFRPGDGSSWIVVGDVAGHGFSAAVVMGRVRSALRSYALLRIPPEEVLALTDRKMAHFDPGEMATVAVIRLADGSDDASVVLAGHLPPLLTLPDQAPGYLEAAPGLPLGIEEVTRPATSFQLPVGSGVVLYTDGLVERRGEDLTKGLDRLRSAVSGDSPATVCQRVMAALVGNDTAADDIAVLAVRRVEAAL